MDEVSRACHLVLYIVPRRNSLLCVMVVVSNVKANNIALDTIDIKVTGVSNVTHTDHVKDFCLSIKSHT